MLSLSSLDLISAVTGEKVKVCTTAWEYEVPGSPHMTSGSKFGALMLGGERWRSTSRRQHRFRVGLAALWSIGREIGQVNISTEHLIESLDVLGDESRSVDYSGVSGILY